MTFDPIVFLERAVEIPSHDGVSEMRDFVEQEVSSRGIDVDVDDAGNTIASRGTGRPHVVLNTHLDTVSPYIPFERNDTIIRGRGSCDAKGSLAALLSAFFDLDPSGRLTIALTPDEETDSYGASQLDIAPDAFVVGEPTALDICNAARGRFEVIVDITGENAHAAEPDTGVNAISAAKAVLSAAESYDPEHGPVTHEALGEPSLTPTVIQGGDAANQVPDGCRIVFDRRSVPPESADEFKESFTEWIQDSVDPDIRINVSFTDRDAPFLGAFETPTDESIVHSFSRAGAGAIRPFGAATEAAMFAAYAPTIVFGPGVLADDAGGVAHSDREYVRTEEVLNAAEILKRGITEFMSDGTRIG